MIDHIILNNPAQMWGGIKIPAVKSRLPDLCKIIKGGWVARKTGGKPIDRNLAVPFRKALDRLRIISFLSDWKIQIGIIGEKANWDLNNPSCSAAAAGRGMAAIAVFYYAANVFLKRPRPLATEQAALDMVRGLYKILDKISDFQMGKPERIDPSIFKKMVELVKNGWPKK